MDTYGPVIKILCDNIVMGGLYVSSALAFYEIPPGSTLLSLNAQIAVRRGDYDVQYTILLPIYGKMWHEQLIGEVIYNCYPVFYAPIHVISVYVEDKTFFTSTTRRIVSCKYENYCFEIDHGDQKCHYYLIGGHGDYCLFAPICGAIIELADELLNLTTQCGKIDAIRFADCASDECKFGTVLRLPNKKIVIFDLEDCDDNFCLLYNCGNKYFLYDKQHDLIIINEQ